FGPQRVDAHNRLQYHNDQIIPLPPKVGDTLLVHVEKAGSVVDKETLLSRVWPDNFVDENNLSQHISVLQRALGNGDSKIETVPKRGYRLIAPVRAPEPPDIPAQGAAPGLRERAKWIAVILLVVA